ncbi:MAG: two-component system response regulator PilR (NtrC family) [Cellvibrionaceae bacterium]|jgi:two-component system response regulator PilR (NtrC family)
MTERVLILDDEPDIRRLLSITIERMGFPTLCVSHLNKAYAALSEGSFKLCITDLRLPDGSGIDLVKLIQSKYNALPVIVITAHGSMDVAIEAMKLGAFDFINKPVDLNHLRSTISNALKTKENQTHENISTEIVGASLAIQQLREKIVKVARSQAPVFITGDSGSGKELVARAIHKFSSRQQKPFVAVNCGAIPRELMESEFFGHNKGSFTGAYQDKIGFFQSAEGGTLFLDEVADLPIDMQVKLLRAIQEKSVRAVGSAKEKPSDVRILSATHKSLLKAIDRGEFRNDLYYRINVIELIVPSLKERVEDIRQLSQILLEKIANKNQTGTLSITEDALRLLETYNFPGNVRELENILERACALCGLEGIGANDLQIPTGLRATNFEEKSTRVVANLDVKNHRTATNRQRGNGYPPELETGYRPEIEALDKYLEGLEKTIILKQLELNRWNRTATASVLGISFRSLRYRMKKLGIDDD